MTIVIWDSLPDCILEKIYEKIYYTKPQNFLNEIKDVYIEKILEKIEEKNLKKIYHIFLHKWHLIYAKYLINEMENEYNMCIIYIQSYNIYKFRIKLWIEEIYKLISYLNKEKIIKIIENF